MVDLGCGTGVLPLVMSENGGYKGSIYAFDNQPNAIEATKMNSQIFGMDDRVKAMELDIVDLYFKDLENQNDQLTADPKQESTFYRKLAKDLGFPYTVHLVVCNPPWIPAAYI